MKVESLMTHDVLTCLAEDTLENATRQMWEADVGSLVVIDAARRPVGMITDRDVAMAAYTRGIALRDATVASAMAKQVVTCTTGTPLADVETLMRDSQVRRLPVVNHRGDLVGIVTLGDIARHAQSSPLHMAEIPGLGRTLAGIMERRSTPASPVL